MKKINCFGWIEKGMLHFPRRVRDRLQAEIKSWPDMDVEVVIRKRGKATSAQRRYYFGVIVPEITAELRRLGNDVDEDLVHELLKLECNRRPIWGEGGEVISYVGGSTTEHNVEERIEYLEACIRYAAQKLGLSIPPPNTQPELFKVA